MKNNTEILAERQTIFNRAHVGPRIGDYLYIPSDDPRIPEYSRFTHIWDDTAQTAGTEHGSYYLGESGLSYSGGLDPGVEKSDLVLTGDYKNGDVWFFDGDIGGAGRGVTFSIPMQVYTVYPGTDLSGVYSRQCPFHLCVLDEDRHHKTCGYWYTITRHSTAHVAFATKQELLLWLKQNNLGLTQPLTNPGEASCQSLKYI